MFSLQIAAAGNDLSAYLPNTFFFHEFLLLTKIMTHFLKEIFSYILHKHLNTSVRYQNCLWLLVSGPKLSFSCRNTTVTGEVTLLSFLAIQVMRLLSHCCLFWGMLPFLLFPKQQSHSPWGRCIHYVERVTFLWSVPSHRNTALLL